MILQDSREIPLRLFNIEGTEVSQAVTLQIMRHNA